MSSLVPTDRALHVVMYHYVRDIPRSRFPRIHGMLTADCAAQVELLSQRYEMASLELSLAFLRGEYTPTRDLCLLTFDDGLAEHYTDVLPILARRNIQGVFGVISSCLEESKVALVHKNHFLIASLDFDQYQSEFLRLLHEVDPESGDAAINLQVPAGVYRWDLPQVAAFKYLLNFQLAEPIKGKVLDALFARHLGDEAEFARELYLNWDQAREMQQAGMLIGGHTHRHQALSTLSDREQIDDLTACMRILKVRLREQPCWPFTYPYGKRISYNAHSVHVLRELGYCCAFSTEVGENRVEQDLFAIRRFDPKDIRN